MSTVIFSIYNALNQPTGDGILIYVLPTPASYARGDVIRRWKYVSPSRRGTTTVQYIRETVLTLAMGETRSPPEDVAPNQFWVGSLSLSGEGVNLEREFPNPLPMKKKQIGVKNGITSPAVNLRAQWHEKQQRRSKVIFTQGGINNQSQRVFERRPELYFVVGRDATTSDLSPKQIAALATSVYVIPPGTTNVHVNWERPAGADTLTFKPPSV